MKNTGKFTIVTIILGVFVNLISTQFENKLSSQNATTNDEWEYPEFIDNREIALTDFEFSLQKHKWYVRVSGLIILVFPWFFSPIGILLEEEIREIKRKAAIALAMTPQFMKKEIAGKINNQWRMIFIPIYLVYLSFYFGVVWATANYLDFSVTKYSLLSAERILNFCFSFI